jgi:hypothetical protein
MAKYTIKGLEMVENVLGGHPVGPRSKWRGASTIWGVWAELYVAALEEAAGGDAVADEGATEVNEAAADVAVSAETVEARKIARRLAKVELGR